MSAEMRGKYEVLSLVRANILKGLGAFGQPVTPNTAGHWQCMEADQPSYKNFDKVVLLTLLKTERIGWQWHDYVAQENVMKVGEKDQWIEQQEWEIKVIMKRTTAPVTANTITVNDAVTMLITWFNNLGCAEFRKNRCGNLFVSQKDVKTYNDSSEVSQFAASFVLKLHVPKNFTFIIDTAKVKYEGTIRV